MSYELSSYGWVLTVINMTADRATPFRLRCLRFFLFFFQAEDGIRDRTVTGVQTCALPISGIRVGYLGGPGVQRPHRYHDRPDIQHVYQPDGGAATRGGQSVFRRVEPVAAGRRRDQRGRLRSEERRVGKECRARGSAQGDRR